VMWKISLNSAQLASEQKGSESTQLGCYSLYRCREPGKILPWISSRNYRNLRVTTQSWWSQIGSRSMHILALKRPFTAAQVAQILLDQVVKLHGLPKSIVSDRDKIFTSHFWTQLFKLLGTKLSLSTAYHPQSDGQSDRVNQCLEMYLRCVVHA
jgi:transposase InsO family protein